MDEHLAATPAAAPHERLDHLDQLAVDGDEPSQAALAETEITRLTNAWRVLLALHAPDEGGRCPHCSAWRWPRHPLHRLDHRPQHLISADGSPAHRPGRRASAAGRSTVAVWGPHDQGRDAVPTAPCPWSTDRQQVRNQAPRL